MKEFVIYIYIIGKHRNFRPIHFSSYCHLKVILETTFRHLKGHQKPVVFKYGWVLIVIYFSQLFLYIRFSFHVLNSLFYIYTYIYMYIYICIFYMVHILSVWAVLTSISATFKIQFCHTLYPTVSSILFLKSFQSVNKIGK